MTRIELHIIVDFAKPGVRAVDYKDDLYSAIAYASINLKSRHDIIIKDREIIPDTGQLLLTVSYPEYVNYYKIGARFKGMSNYLLGNASPDSYKDHTLSTDFSKLCVGTALLRYSIKAEDADMVRVVRCKDCFWYVIFEYKNDETPDRRYKPSWCELWRAEFPEDGYCSAGKRDSIK